MPTCDRWKSVKDGRGESRQSDRRRQIEALRRVLTQVNNSWRSKQAQLTSPVWRRPRGAGNGSPGEKKCISHPVGTQSLFWSMPCLVSLRLYDYSNCGCCCGAEGMLGWRDGTFGLASAQYVCARPPYVRALVHTRTFRRCMGGVALGGLPHWGGRIMILKNNLLRCICSPGISLFIVCFFVWPELFQELCSYIYIFSPKSSISRISICIPDVRKMCASTHKAISCAINAQSHSYRIWACPLFNPGLDWWGLSCLTWLSVGSVKLDLLSD